MPCVDEKTGKNKPNPFRSNVFNLFQCFPVYSKCYTPLQNIEVI